MLTKDQRITEAKLDELDAQHDGRILRASQDVIPRRKLTIPSGAVEWECIFRAPKRQEFALYQQQNDAQASPSTRAMSTEMLARTCVVHVSGGVGATVHEQFDALLERYPAIPQRVANALAKLAGFEIDIVEK